MSFLERLVNSSPVRRSPSTQDAVGDSDSPCGPLRERIRELIDEVRTQNTNLSKYSKRYVHNFDVVLTLGYSESVFQFLAGAANLRRFAVLVLEHAPEYDGLIMSKKLHNIGIETTVIPDSAGFALMPRVTTVFLSVRGVLADGTMTAMSYTGSVCLAAKHHGKPIVVLYSNSKLANLFSKPGDDFTALNDPGSVAEFAKGAVAFSPDGEAVSAEFPTLFINENGAHAPADVFPNVQMLYHGTEEV